MPKSHLNHLLLLLFAIAASGCQLPTRYWPVTQSVVNCRQMTRQGVIAMERGQAAEAEDLLEKAVKTCSVDCDARIHYAEVLWQRGAKDEAIEQLKEAIQLAGEDAKLQARLAEMELAVDEVDEARKNAERALDVTPKSAAAWAVRGRVMRRQGNIRQALANYHQSLSVEPENRELLLEVAELHRELNQPRRALSTLYRLAELYPPGDEPQQVLYLTGLAYMALGRHEDGATAFADAAKRGDASVDLYYQLANAHMQNGRLTEAAEAARYALALEPNHLATRQLLSEVSNRQGVAQQSSPEFSPTPLHQTPVHQMPVHHIPAHPTQIASPAAPMQLR